MYVHCTCITEYGDIHIQLGKFIYDALRPFDSNPVRRQKKLVFNDLKKSPRYSSTTPQRCRYTIIQRTVDSRWFETFGNSK